MTEAEESALGKAMASMAHAERGGKAIKWPSPDRGAASVDQEIVESDVEAVLEYLRGISWCVRYKGRRSPQIIGREVKIGDARLREAIRLAVKSGAAEMHLNDTLNLKVYCAAGARPGR